MAWKRTMARGFNSSMKIIIKHENLTMGSKGCCSFSTHTKKKLKSFEMCKTYPFFDGNDIWTYFYSTI